MIGAFAAAAGFRSLTLGEVTLTNDVALERARKGEDRLWVVADAQSGGRGRRGRGWTSPIGNLYASLLIVDPAPGPRAPQIGFVAALALHDAVASLLTPEAAASLKLKWPNDVMIDGAKLSGILAEATGVGPGRTAVVIGIGVNLVAHATGAPYATTHLAAHPLRARGDLRAALFAALSDAMARRIVEWRAGENFARTRMEWLARAAGLGLPVRVEGVGETIVGRFSDMDAGGRLVVVGEDGAARNVEAGDVFLSAQGGDAGAARQG